MPEGNKIWVLGDGVETHAAGNLYHAALDSGLSQSLTFRTTIAELRSHVVGDCSARIKRMVTRGNVGFEEIRF